MVVGICKIDFLIHGNFSLKGKRQIVRSVIEKVKNRFNVSIAEVGDNDLWQRGKIGFCVVGNDKGHVNSVVDKTINYMVNLNLIDLVDCSIEFVHFNDAHK